MRGGVVVVVGEVVVLDVVLDVEAGAVVVLEVVELGEDVVDEDVVDEDVLDDAVGSSGDTVLAGTGVDGTGADRSAPGPPPIMNPINAAKRPSTP